MVDRIKKTTIYDIALEAGTSVATVSRILSNSNHPVRESVRQKVLETAEKLNYEPNMIGRMLKTSKSKDIGVIVPTISNPFYTQIVLGIEEEARRRGYAILLCNSYRDASTERKYIKNLNQKQVSGIIISSIGENHTLLKEIHETGVNLTVFDQHVDDIKCSKVGFNYIAGGMMAVQHLIDSGHTNIAFLSSPLTRRSRKEIYEGYRLALLKNNIQIKEENIIISEYEGESENGTYEFENGEKLVKELIKLSLRPTAIFAVNDMTAFGINQGLLKNKIKVPEDVSIVGFDNLEISSMINPSLTTINQPSFETGRMACKLLLDSIENSVEDVSITLEPSLIVRDSVMNLLR